MNLWWIFIMLVRGCWFKTWLFVRIQSASIARLDRSTTVEEQLILLWWCSSSYFYSAHHHNNIYVRASIHLLTLITTANLLNKKHRIYDVFLRWYLRSFFLPLEKSSGSNRSCKHKIKFGRLCNIIVSSRKLRVISFKLFRQCLLIKIVKLMKERKKTKWNKLFIFDTRLAYIQTPPDNAIKYGRLTVCYSSLIITNSAGKKTWKKLWAPEGNRTRNSCEISDLRWDCFVNGTLTVRLTVC